MPELAMLIVVPICAVTGTFAPLTLLYRKLKLAADFVTLSTVPMEPWFGPTTKLLFLTVSAVPWTMTSQPPPRLRCEAATRRLAGLVPTVQSWFQPHLPRPPAGAMKSLQP